jgi:hypothetical protein
MRVCFCALSFLLAACGGSLSDEQRKKIKQDMEEHKIVRVTDAEITEQAFTQGREFVKAIIKANGNSSALDSLSAASHIKIKWLVPGASNALEIERQLVDAYLTSVVNGGMEDNIQRIGTDTLLYTKPVSEKMPDGSEVIKGIWSIHIPKKELILKMNR